METTTENYQLNSDLTLTTSSSGSPLFVRAVALALTQENNQLIEYRLSFKVSPELYQRIDSEALFNLKPQVRGSLRGGEFLPELDILIEAMLKPNLLPSLGVDATTFEEAASYILNLNQEQPDAPLLLTENWLGLSVTQPLESGETGYRTFWNYISPSAIAQAGSSSEEISDKIVNFFQEWTQTSMSGMTDKAHLEMLEEMVNFLKELADFVPDTFTQKIQAGLKPTFRGGQILEAIINFFTEDDWSYTKIQGEPTLSLAFQGENGKWICYAKSRTEQAQFVFYSICPVNAPENKRSSVAEFITRANYGTIIGNFELDYTDGEIRYKTSIDVEGSNLTFPLIKQLVYANVTMMDEYLPGIVSVIEGDVEPKEAIRAIEQREANDNADSSRS